MTTKNETQKTPPSPIARAWQYFGGEIHTWEEIPADCRAMTTQAYCLASGEECNPEQDSGDSLVLVRFSDDGMEPVGEVWGLETDTGDLHDYETGERLREATAAETRASVDAARTDGGAGVIPVDGRSCYVQGGTQ